MSLKVTAFHVSFMHLVVIARTGTYIGRYLIPSEVDLELFPTLRILAMYEAINSKVADFAVYCLIHS